MKKTLLLISVTILLSIGLQAQEWNFGNDSTNFPDYPGVPAGTTVTILGLDITAGTSPTNMGLVESSMKTFGTTTYHRRFKFNGGGYSGAAATDLEPTVNMPTQRYISFPVSGNSTFLVHGITGSSSSARKLFVTDGKNYIGAMDFPAGSEITEATLTYTGPAATLYMFCNASINLYYLKVETATGPASYFVKEDFESLKMILMKADPPAEDLSYFQVIANPDTAGPTNINKSLTVCKFVRSMNGLPWDGFYAPLSTPLDMVNNHYIHAKVWKPRISPVKAKIQTGTGNDLEIESINPQTVENGWEEVVFDMSSVSGTYNQFNFMPDVLDPVGLTEDITIYFDDFYINNDPAVGSAPVQVIEDYEYIPLEPFGTGTCTLIPNPDKTGINLSNYVLDYLRPMNDVAWSGFFSALPVSTVFDVTANHFVHVKVWKPRVSEMRFKLEGGTSGTKEFPSMNAFTDADVNKWVDMVFDVTEYTGTYPKIGILADYNGAALTADIHIYIDDIILNNDSIPITPTEQRINVDMNSADLVAGDMVFITGSFGGIYGTWNMPGENPACEMTDPDGDGIYTITMQLPDGAYTLKMAIVKTTPTWDFQDPYNTDRPLTISGNANVLFTWGVAGFVDATVSFRENKLAGKILMYPNPVRDNLTISTSADIRKVIITNTLGKVVGNYTYTSQQNIDTKNLNRGMYFVTFIGRDGNKVTQKLIKN